MFCGFTKGMADDSVLLPPFMWAMRIDGKIPTRDTEGDNRLLPPPHMRAGLARLAGLAWRLERVVVQVPRRNYRRCHQLHVQLPEAQASVNQTNHVIHFLQQWQ